MADLGQSLMEISMGYDDALTADVAKVEATDEAIEEMSNQWANQKTKLASLIRSLTSSVSELKQDALSADPAHEHEDAMRQLRSEQGYVNRQLQELEINLQGAKTKVGSIEAEKDAVRCVLYVSLSYNIVSMNDCTNLPSICVARYNTLSSLSYQ